MQVFYYGCRCGTVGRLINKLRAYCRENNIKLEILNSKYDKEVRTDHLNLLMLNCMGTGRLIPIVVNNNTVRKLAEWNF